MKPTYFLPRPESAGRFLRTTFAAVAALALTATGSSADQDSGTTYAVFMKESPQSDFSILYDDLDLVLRQIVLETGRSDRSVAKRARPAAGSRIIRGSTSRFGLEGNRVHFPALARGENLALLSRIRKELEAVPDTLPLRLLNRKEQLAYWLNLYNVTVLEQVALIYPESRLKKQYRSDNSFWTKKLLTVAGIPLSLNDIQHRIIIPRFENPLVMYGMFQGFIGGPNIRNEAYRGEDVFRQLKDNAEEFINSNRGMHTNERLMRISHLYRVNEALFPDWERDLKKHLSRYTTPYYRERIRKASRLSPKVSDFGIVDIYNGVQSRSSAVNTNAAAFLGAIESPDYGSQASGARNDHDGGGFTASGPGGGFVSADGGAVVSMALERLQSMHRDGGRFPSHVMQYLINVHIKNQKAREGDVTIEEMDNQQPSSDSSNNTSDY